MGYIVNDVFPAGVVFPYAGAAAPTGWLLCDGSAVSRTTYARLFASIGTTFGSGDGSTTFNLPNTQGVFVRGAGSQTISSLTYTGTLGTKTIDQIQGHYHSKVESAHQHGFTSGGGNSIVLNDVNGFNPFGFVPGGSSYKDYFVPATGDGTSNVSIRSPSNDGSNGNPRTGTQTHPANIGMNHIIKI